jgi:hypothetical protein
LIAADKVYLGDSYGYVTPASVGADQPGIYEAWVSPGQYKVVVQKSGYEDFVTTESVQGGEDNTVIAPLMANSRERAYPGRTHHADS